MHLASIQQWIEKLRTSPTMVLFVVSFGLFVEEILYGVVVPLTPESPAHIKDEHMLSIMYGAYALGLIITTPILAVTTDRLGRRRPMVLGAVFLLVATVLFSIGTTTEMHFVARFLEGIGAACTWTAGLALVAKYYVKNRVKGMGYAMIGATTGSIIGPLVGGEIFATAGYSAAYYAVIGVLVVDLAVRFLFTPQAKTRSNKKPWKDWFAELGGIVTDKSVLSAAFAVALAAAGWSLMEPLFPMHVIKMGHTSPAIIGALFTASNFLYAFCTPVVTSASEHLGVRKTTVLGLIFTAVCLPLLAFTGNLYLATGVLCLVTIGYAFTINPTSAELGDAVDRRGSNSYSVAYAVYNLAYSLGMIGVDAYLQYVTDKAHKLDLFHILLFVSVLFLCCAPLFMFKPKIHGVLHETDDDEGVYNHTPVKEVPTNEPNGSKQKDAPTNKDVKETTRETNLSKELMDPGKETHPSSAPSPSPSIESSAGTKESEIRPSN